MKQLFALFENSENGMSTDKMKWSITTSFIDAGTSRDGDKIQEVRKKPEAKLDSKLHDLKVNRYNFRSYLTYLDVEGGSEPMRSIPNLVVVISQFFASFVFKHIYLLRGKIYFIAIQIREDQISPIHQKLTS